MYVCKQIVFNVIYHKNSNKQIENKKKYIKFTVYAVILLIN